MGRTVDFEGHRHLLWRSKTPHDCMLSEPVRPCHAGIEITPDRIGAEAQMTFDLIVKDARLTDNPSALIDIGILDERIAAPQVGLTAGCRLESANGHLVIPVWLRRISTWTKRASWVDARSVRALCKKQSVKRRVQSSASPKKISMHAAGEY
jgi:hypothetical protein